MEEKTARGAVILVWDIEEKAAGRVCLRLTLVHKPVELFPSLRSVK